MNLTHKYVFVCLSKHFPLSQYVVYHYNLYLQHVQTGKLILFLHKFGMHFAWFAAMNNMQKAQMS
jgi:hypothetical protein